MKVFLKLLILSLICFSCAVGPKYCPPSVETPETWKHSQTSENFLKDDGEESENFVDQPFSDKPSLNHPSCINFWWEIFGDEILNQQEIQAIAFNPNLKVALDRVAEARAMAFVDRSSLYPQINLAPSYTNQSMLFKLFLPSGTNLPVGLNFPDVYRIHQLQYVMPINFSYEIDLWGKLRKQYESGVLNAQSVEEDFQSALLTLTADVATAYIKIRTFDAELEVIESNLALLNDNLNLTISRYKKGLVGKSDELALKQEVSDAESYRYDVIRQRELQVNILATLTGKIASEFELCYAPLRSLPPLIPAGVPSSILLKRPDIAAAEKNIASEHALVNVAYAAFFPSFELTGALGFSSPDIRQFLRWKSRLWMMGMNAMQPIFNGGYNQANLNLAYAYYYEATHQFEQKVLTAFQETEDALINLEMQKKRYDSYAISSEAALERTKLSQNRYRSGLANYLEVLDSERSKLQSDSNLIQALGYRYISTIQLIKALGGSWEYPQEGL